MSGSSDDIKRTLIPAEGATLQNSASIFNALELIDHSAAKIVLVVNSRGVLIGSITDGDIRRGLLRGLSLHAPISEVMHENPSSLPATSSRQQILDVMQNMRVQQIPLLDGEGKIVGIALRDRLVGMTHSQRPNRVVIMAGGKGTRLLPITKEIPKPMVEVAGRPILEWIVQRFITNGFRDITLAINYLGHMIESHFEDGSQFGCHITYIREQSFMGTAGALSMLDPSITDPIILTNGDILSSVDFAQVMDHHMMSGSVATVCARPHLTEVPFGVIRSQKGLLQDITEKPVYEDLVSAGIYVINPDVLRYIPRNTVTDMPSVLLSLVKDRQKVSVFTMGEEWIDIGRHDDLERAKLVVNSEAP